MCSLDHVGISYKVTKYLIFNNPYTNFKPSATRKRNYQWYTARTQFTHSVHIYFSNEQPSNNHIYPTKKACNCRGKKTGFLCHCRNCKNPRTNRGASNKKNGTTEASRFPLEGGLIEVREEPLKLNLVVWLPLGFGEALEVEDCCRRREEAEGLKWPGDGGGRGGEGCLFWWVMSCWKGEWVVASGSD